MQGFGLTAPAGDNEIGTAALYGIGICRAKIPSNFSCVMPVRASTRAFWRKPSADTTTAASHRTSSLPRTTAGCRVPPAARAGQHNLLESCPAPVGPADERWIPELSARHRHRRRACQTHRGPPHRRTPHPETQHRWARRTAFTENDVNRSVRIINRHAHAAEHIVKAVDFPIPMEPVKPSIISASKTWSRRTRPTSGSVPNQSRNGSVPDATAYRGHQPSGCPGHAPPLKAAFSRAHRQYHTPRHLVAARQRKIEWRLPFHAERRRIHDKGGAIQRFRAFAPDYTSDRIASSSCSAFARATVRLATKISVAPWS